MKGAVCARARAHTHTHTERERERELDYSMYQKKRRICRPLSIDLVTPLMIAF